MAVTLTALLYVHQQVELVKLSYSIDCKEKKLEDILDHKQQLEYNINNLEAPSRLEKVLLSKNVNVAFPKKSQVVKVADITSGIGATSVRAASVEDRGNTFGILEFFGLRTEAQAKER